MRRSIPWAPASARWTSCRTATVRPRALPDWPYNLFAMLHGHSRDEVEARRTEVAALLGEACRGHDILYSTRILKKTGLRLTGEG
jgi:hypothetical protein